MTKHSKYNRAAYGLCAAIIAAAPIVGCDLLGGVALTPFGVITSVQLFDEPPFTVAFSVDTAVTNPDGVTKVNWVFGDGGGFVEGQADRVSITHRYDATGTFEVTAYIFDANGLVDQITSLVDVVSDGTQPPPTPTDLPGTIAGANPSDGATNVDVATMLTWTSGANATSHDVYLGSDEGDVDAATDADAVNFKGNQEETAFDPGGLLPDAQYFWRIDEVNAAGITKGAVMDFTTAVAPEEAETPVPSNGSNSARVDQLLAWSAGDNADSHDVYFGKDMSAVADADTETDDVFQGNQTATTFDPEDEAASLPGELLASTTYYWRIDEVGPGGTTKGDLWSFTTRAPPPPISAPNPPDVSTDIPVDQILTWSAPSSVESFDVYVGTDAIDVGLAEHSSPEFMGNQTAKLFDPGILLENTDFFWRIDTVGAGGTSLGLVLTFLTAERPGQVTGPFTPANNTLNVNVETMLEWNAPAGGGPVESYNVYLSTSQTAVNNRQNSALVDNVDAGMTTFTPDDPIAASTDFFWAVDAVGPGGVSDPTPAMTFRTGALPDLATMPMPPNNDTAVEPDVMLSWTAGTNAMSHDVYFGTSQSSVNNATTDEAEFKGNQLLGDETFSPPDGVAGSLAPNTQFFWRIDELGIGGTRKGTIWNFRTGPGKAVSPQPADGAEDVDPTTNLVWTAGAGASTHDVYLGTDESAVEMATLASTGIFRGNQGSTTFNPPTDLDANTAYYWRIDEVAADGVTRTTGDVWTFMTRLGKATDPVPANNATDVPLDTFLEWTAGDGADMHDVYFGTNLADVSNATTADAEYRGQQANALFDPTSVETIMADTQYFWRIDTVADGGMPVTKGDVWRYRTQAPPSQASGPNPTNGSTGVSTGSSLNWAAATGADEYDVYFISQADNDALPAPQKIAVADDTSPAFQGTQMTRTFSPPLSAGTMYLWRIDSKNEAGTTTGIVWTFMTSP
jgi:hypothetical protein